MVLTQLIVNTVPNYKHIVRCSRTTNIQHHTFLYTVAFPKKAKKNRHIRTRSPVGHQLSDGLIFFVLVLWFRSV